MIGESQLSWPPAQGGKQSIVYLHLLEYSVQSIAKVHGLRLGSAGRTGSPCMPDNHRLRAESKINHILAQNSVTLVCDT